MTDHLESGFTAMDEFEWELGGLRWSTIGESGDQGLDDLAETEDDAEDAPVDGAVGGRVRLTPRAIAIPRWFAPDVNDLGDRAEALADELDALRAVMSPLPDRTSTQLLRWRRRGEVAKRISVRPAVGKPLDGLIGDRNRLLHDSTPVTLRLTAPQPVILSDVWHEETFTAGETKTIHNAGTLTAVQPIAWWIESTTAVTIEHMTYTDEYIRFPSGPVSTTRDLTIDATGGFGLCWGRNSSPFPKWPLLRPGDNPIKASAACTFRWRDTW